MNETEPSSEAERHVAAVLAALSLLDCFDSDISLRLRDLHERTGFQKSRILRLAGTLAAGGYLTIESSGGYRLGPRVASLGQLVAESINGLIARVHPVLERVCNELGDTCFFSVVRGTHRLAADKVTPSNGLMFTISQGQTRPLHRGATGRILLAYGPDLLADKVLATNSEINNALADEVRSDLVKAIEQGYLLSVGHLTAHTFAIAVPVLGAAGELLGAMTVAGPESKVSPGEAAQIAKHMNIALTDAGFLTSVA